MDQVFGLESSLDSPRKELMVLGHLAWTAHPESEPDRRRYVISHLERQSSWALINEYQPHLRSFLVGSLLRDTKPTKAERSASGSGQRDRDTHLVPAASGSHPSREGGGGHIPPDAQRVSAPAKAHGSPREDQSASRDATPMVKPRTGPDLSELARKQRLAHEANLTVRSRLDIFLIDEKPIKDCTVAEVRAFMVTREKDRRTAGHDIRFCRLMIGNLAGNEVIGKWVTADEADQYYARAEADSDA